MGAVRRAVLAWACLLAAGPAAGQGVTAAIEGRVIDDTAAPVARVTIAAVNPATGFERMATTDGDGRYVLVGLPVEGEYRIRAESPAFSLAVREHVTLLPGQTLVVDFTLRVRAQATVSVDATSTQLGRAHATLQQTIDEGLVRALPVSGRGFLPLASLAPGFTGHPDFPNPQGQTYWANNVVVDGASHFSKWRSAARSFSSGVPLEAVSQVQVLTGLFSAEFGESLASLTSVRTRAGTNEWHGSALVFARDAVLDAPPPFSARKPPGGGQQYGFSLGGPLATNRTQFFGAYEHRRARDRNIVVSPAALNAEVPDNQDERLPFFRVDHQRRGQLFTARYSGQLFRWHHEPGGLSLPGVGTTYTTNVHTLLVTAGVPVSARTLHEVRFQFSRFVDRRRDIQPSVYVSRAGYSIEGGTLGPTGFGATPEDTWEAADTLTHLRGSHALRLGGGLKSVRAHNTGLPYGWGAYFFAGSPAQVTQPYLFMQGLAPTPEAAIAEPRSLSAFGFIQDDWTIHSSLRVSLGVRYDVERVSNIRAYDVNVDANNVQPRVGVAWAIDDQGRTIVRGGVGLYTQQHLLFPINRVQLEGADGAVGLALAPNSPQFPQFPRAFVALPGAALPPRDIVRLDPAFRNAYAVQSALGVQRQVPGGVLTADYVALNGRDLMSLIDVNAPASVLKPAQRTIDQADATRPIRPAAGGFRKIVTLGNEGQSWYRALEVTFDGSAGPVRLLAAYTLSRAQDAANYQLPEDSRNPGADKGLSSADVRHNLSSAFSWDAPGTRPLTRGWSVAGIGSFRGSRPYTISWGDDRNGTTQNDARPGARNTGKTGRYDTVDVSVTKRFRRGVTTIDARVQAFNALNATNYDQYVGELLSPLFGRPVSAFPPRRIELAAIVRF